MKKIYSQAPLPFMGQKRRFIESFKQALNSVFKDDYIFVDLFGGSGFLSYLTKCVRPDATVIYNDFDDYHVRINHIKETNTILSEIREIITSTLKESKVTNDVRDSILKIVKRADKKGYVDYITISSNLLFSMKYVTNYEALTKQGIYNNMRQSKYIADGYLDGIDVVKMDYRDLFYKYRMHPDVVFFIDPPYLSTEVGTYNCQSWKLGNYLDVLHTVRDTSYFYFTSNKSSVLELCDWIDKNLHHENPFKGAIMITAEAQLNYSSRYTDIMLYKHK